VSDDVDAAGDFVAEQLSFCEASAADLAAVGSVVSIRRRLQSYLVASAAVVVLSPLAWADAAVAEELWAVAASL